MGAWIMAGVTFREAARKKILWMALALGLAFLGLFATGLHFQGQAVSDRRDAKVFRSCGVASAQLPAGNSRCKPDFLCNDCVLDECLAILLFCLGRKGQVWPEDRSRQMPS